MELIKCANAYTAVLALQKVACDYGTASALVTLKRRLEPHAELFAEKEMELAEQYGEKDADGKLRFTGPGKVRLQDTQAAWEYAKARERLAMTEVQEEFPKLHARPPEKITAEQLEALEEFLEFGEG